MGVVANDPERSRFLAPPLDLNGHLSLSLLTLESEIDEPIATRGRRVASTGLREHP